MEVLKNFKYIKEAKLLTNYKAEILEGLQDAINEVKQIKHGKLKGIAAKDLLNELWCSGSDGGEDIYFQGMISVYEQNDISLLKDVFIWSYERSANQYAVIRQSLGEPDTFKLKYRMPIKQLITSIIMKADSIKNMLDIIKSDAEAIPEQDREQIIRSVENEITSLHEGNFARYRVSRSAFARFKNKTNNGKKN